MSTHPSPSLRGGIGALAMAVAVGAALVACGSDDKPAARLGGTATTTTAPATTVAPGGYVPDTTSTTAGGSPGSTGVTSRPGATAPPVATAPNAFSPPAAGRYQYSTTGSSSLGTSVTPVPAVTSLVVDAPTGGRQHSLRSLKDAAGQGISTDFDLDYRADGVFLVSAKVNVTQGAFITTVGLLPPAPVLFVPTAAAPGAHTEADVPTDSGAPVRFVVDVLRTEAVAVGPTSVNALVVRSVATSLPGAQNTTRQELTLWFDPGSRLVVKESSLITASALGGLVQFKANSDSTLQSLRPA